MCDGNGRAWPFGTLSFFLFPRVLKGGQAVAQRICLDRGFLIRRRNQIFCSKCGERLLQDNYRMGRHISHCRMEGGLPVVLREEKDYVYSLEITEDHKELHFVAFTPRLSGGEGFFRKETEWEEVYRGIFRQNENTVEEHGLYDIEKWLRDLEGDKKIPSLTWFDPFSMIREVFPNILRILSPGDFLNQYRNGRLACCRLLKDKEAEKILAGRPLFDDEEEVSEITVRGKLIRRQGNKILHVGIKVPGKKEMGILMAKNYLYANKEYGEEICRLIRKPGILVENQISERAAEEFDRCYPSFMLEKYLKEGGRNVLIPLFSAKADRYVELLYKAGMPYLAENMQDIIENNYLALEKKNLSDIFELPVKTLRKFSFAGISGEEGIFDSLKRLYAIDRGLFSLPEYNYLSVMFLKELDLRLCETVPEGHQESHVFDGWTRDEILRTLKYVTWLNGPQKTKTIKAQEAAKRYVDYLLNCKRLGMYIEGKWPRDIKTAHEKAAELFYTQKDRILAENFNKVVTSEEYRFFTTGYEAQREYFEEDPYTIISPKSIWEMQMEASLMHNCVESYSRKVAEEETKVYFLRQKEKPEDPLCTIEVSRFRELVQLKAFANQKAPKNIREFVRKWAKIKNITVMTTDVA